MIDLLVAGLIGAGLGLLCAAMVIFHGTWEARKTHRLRDYLDRF